MKTANSLIISCVVFAFACQGDADQTADTGTLDADASVDADATAVDDRCVPEHQSIAFTFTQLVTPANPETFMTEHENTYDLDDSEGAHAVVEDGVLRIRFNRPPNPMAGDISGFSIAAKSNLDGPFPTTIELKPPRTDGVALTDEEAYEAGSWTQYGLAITQSSFTQAYNSWHGSLTLDTCPNGIGDIAVGSFADITANDLLRDVNAITGTFTAIVVESDGSLNCTIANLCPPQ